jgi:hypothetical protein
MPLLLCAAVTTSELAHLEAQQGAHTAGFSTTGAGTTTGAGLAVARQVQTHIFL